eukprot:933921-Karenia_brevis.AAC.1
MMIYRVFHGALGRQGGSMKKFGILRHKRRRLLKKPDAAREMATTPSESAREEDADYVDDDH